VHKTPERRFPAAALLAFYSLPTPFLLKSYLPPTRLVPSDICRKQAETAGIQASIPMIEASRKNDGDLHQRLMSDGLAGAGLRPDGRDGPRRAARLTTGAYAPPLPSLTFRRRAANVLSDIDLRHHYGNAPRSAHPRGGAWCGARERAESRSFLPRWTKRRRTTGKHRRFERIIPYSPFRQKGPTGAYTTQRRVFLTRS
jgi:hypothetical protein